MAGGGVQRVHLAVVAADVDGPARDGRVGERVRGASGVVGPVEVAGGGVQGEHLGTPEVDGSPRYDWAEANEVPGGVAPAEVAGDGVQPA